MIGFFFGYLFGTKAGKEGYEEMKESLLTIASSGEMRDLVGGAISVVGDVLRQGQSTVGGSTERASLRRIA